MTRTRPASRWLIVGGAATALIVLALAVAANWALTLHAINQRNRVWCPILASLTTRPPQHADPAELRTFRELAQIRDSFHC